VKQKIIYRQHLKRRLKERKIPHYYPRKIIQNPRFNFFDSSTNHHIAISKLKYAEKIRNLAISYDIINNTIEVITIHPVSDNEIENKVKNKRWLKK
jgi:uncharacterized protein (DUF4213/DUF364 family)